jgi:hypothetical protein
MTTTVKRKKTKTADWVTAAADFRQQLVWKNEAAKLTERSEKIRKKIKAAFSSFATRTNDQGSQFVDFAQTVEVDGVAYKGMENRRTVPVEFDEDVAEKVLKRKKLLDQALSTYIDQDKVLVLHQTGALTEKELDSMFVSGDEKWALWAVKGEVIE